VARNDEKDTAPVAARTPVAARRLPSNSQKLITNLFYGEKGSLMPHDSAETKGKGSVSEIVAQWNENAILVRENNRRAATSRRCRPDIGIGFSTALTSQR